MTNADIKRLTLLASLAGTVFWAVKMFREAQRS